MPRTALYHKIKVTLPNGKEKHTSKIGCYPYAIATRQRKNNRYSEWKVSGWCKNPHEANRMAGELATKWHPDDMSVEVEILNTSCHGPTDP